MQKLSVEHWTKVRVNTVPSPMSQRKKYHRYQMSKLLSIKKCLHTKGHYNISIALCLLKYPKTVSYKLFLGFCNIANKNDTLLKDDWSRLLPAPSHLCKLSFVFFEPAIEGISLQAHFFLKPYCRNSARLPLLVQLTKLYPVDNERKQSALQKNKIRKVLRSGYSDLVY